MKEIFKFIKRNRQVIYLFLAISLVLCLCNCMFFNKSVIEPNTEMTKEQQERQRQAQEDDIKTKPSYLASLFFRKLINNVIGAKYNAHTHKGYAGSSGPVSEADLVEVDEEWNVAPF